MQFGHLLSTSQLPAPLRGGDTEVDSICIDSRRCRAGCCFVAAAGTHVDGHAFIRDAVSAGASAIVCRDPQAVPNGVATAVVDDPRRAAGLLAQAVRGWPARRLTCIGVTGTNGKTTVAHMVRAMVIAGGGRAGLLGTIAYDTGVRRGASSVTTPDPVELAAMTAEMVAAGRTHLVMEVSSHALDQDRTAGLDFRVGIFTNLTGDHLDYHGSMDAYGRAKARLFAALAPESTAVINADDAAGRRMADASRAPVGWYGVDADADIRARIERADAAGTVFQLDVPGRRVRVEAPLIGLHNVRNALAAVAAGLALDIPLETLVRALREMPFVAGRLQRVGGDVPFDVFVDYAHTDDALRNVLTALRPLCRGRLIVVFGCGGDRDRTKRPRMARVAQELADCLVITSDNPRSEDPRAIIDEMLAGLDRPARDAAVVEVDRRRAIGQAIRLAGPGDIVLIAGKGHETYQIIGSTTTDFDDAAVAREMIAARRRAGSSETP